MSKEEDFACEIFTPQKWRKDVCKNCYQVLRLHKKKTDRKPSSGTQQNEDGYVKQLLQQDVNLVDKEKDKTEKNTPAKSVPAANIPTKPSPPPATRPKPNPGRRTSSLKRNALLPNVSTDNDSSNSKGINTLQEVTVREPPANDPAIVKCSADEIPTIPLPTTTSCESDTPTTNKQSTPNNDDSNMSSNEIIPGKSHTPDPQSDTLTTDSQSDMLTTDPQSDTPTTDPKSIVPTIDPQTDTPTTDPQSDTPTTDPQSDTPTTDPKSVAPTIDPQTDTPTTDPQSDTPTSDPKSVAPTIDPQTDTPTSDPQSDTPTSDPKSVAPTIDPQTDTPTTDPQSDTPTSDPKSVAPTIDPQPDMPPTGSQLNTPTTNLEYVREEVVENVPLSSSPKPEDSTSGTISDSVPPSVEVMVDSTPSVEVMVDSTPSVEVMVDSTPSIDVSNNEASEPTKPADNIESSVNEAVISPDIPSPPAPTPTHLPISTEGTDLLIPLEKISALKVAYDEDEDEDMETSESVSQSDNSTNDLLNTPPSDSFVEYNEETNQSAVIPSPPHSPPSFSSLPPPPPPPPPIASPTHVRLPKVRVLSNRSNEVPPKLTPPPVNFELGALLHQIETGTKLRSVPPPVERTPTEEKVTDIRSELRQRVLKLRKKENEAISEVIVEKRTLSNALCQQIVKFQGRKTYFHNLVDMLKRMDEFVTECNLSPEVMEKKMNWPLWLVEQLRNVVRLMTGLDSQIADVEKLCNNTMKTQQLNVEKVQRCVSNVIFTVRNIKNDLSRETSYTTSLNVFPVDDIDIHRLLRRAVESVTPLLDKLYGKALYSHSMVSDPSVGKFDLNFRLQNSIRLLRMCCQMSDTLMTHLDVQRHPKYSEAMLKGTELDHQYKKQISVLERKGEWDENQEVELLPSYSRRSPSVIQEENTLVDDIIEVIKNGGTDDEITSVAEKMTEEVFVRAEIKLAKVALSSCQTKMVDAVMLLRNKFLTDESKKVHEFDWLHEAVQKANHDCLKHLVTVSKLSVNCQSADAGNSTLHIAGRRQDWSTMACLIKLGANPLLVNSTSKSAIRMIALKYFPPQHFPEIKIRELPFNLSSYINNESLSDAKLVSNEGEEFYVHRLILCGQSPVFRSMLESELWINDRQEGNKIPLPNINSLTVKLLLQYLYTGESTFPHDDLNSWIELLSAADEFLLEPLRLQCEKVLSENIDSEVVIPMLYGSHRCSAKKLLVNCCNYILEHYEDITDPNNEMLLYILDNASDMMPKR